jgi:hypothetical protein
LNQCGNNYTDKTILSTIPKHSFVDVGLFPNHLVEFKRYLPELKSIFKLKPQFIQEAQET